MKTLSETGFKSHFKEEKLENCILKYKTSFANVFFRKFYENGKVGDLDGIGCSSVWKKKLTNWGIKYK